MKLINIDFMRQRLEGGLSRRRFLVNSAGVAGIAALPLSALASNRLSTMQSNKRYNNTERKK
jgi:hypothetical protein